MKDLVRLSFESLRFIVCRLTSCGTVRAFVLLYTMKPFLLVEDTRRSDRMDFVLVG